MTLARDKLSVCADLPVALKSSFLYLADQIEALQDAEDRQDGALTDVESQVADLNTRVFGARGVHIVWPTRVPIPGYLLAALANATGEQITLDLIPS